MKHSGWNRHPPAVTIFPEIDREQDSQLAVGTPDREYGVDHRSWISEACRLGWACRFWLFCCHGCGACFIGLLCCCAGSLISEIVGSLMSGTLITGIGGGSDTSMLGATSIVGTEGAGGAGDAELRPPWFWRGGFGWSLGCHFVSKLTIGRPTRSLTAEGMGRPSLRSLSFLLVAARMSSLRISFPSFIGTGSSLGMATGGGVGSFLVYPGFRD